MVMRGLRKWIELLIGSTALSMVKTEYIPVLKPISEFINESDFKVTYSNTEVDDFEVSIEDLEGAIYDVRERLKLKLRQGKVSSVLINQLAKHKLQVGEKFGNEIHFYHFQTILDTIECVEKGYTMNVRDFRKPLLAHFKHIHHNSNTFVVHNMLNYWKKMIGKEDEISFQNELLQKIYINLVTNGSSKEVAQKRCITILLGQIQDKNQLREQKRKTGEWIILYPKDGINYYLCLATHMESKEYSDQVVYDRLAPCLEEFPE